MLFGLAKFTAPPAVNQSIIASNKRKNDDPIYQEMKEVRDQMELERMQGSKTKTMAGNCVELEFKTI